MENGRRTLNNFEQYAFETLLAIQLEVACSTVPVAIQLSFNELSKKKVKSQR